MRTCFISIDIENDPNQKTFKGVENLENILDVFEKHKVKATLFVTGQVLEKYPDLVKKWAKGHEIGCHSYKHIDLDKIDLVEREEQIKNFVKLYKSILNQRLKGFRAPGNVVDNEQFSILEKYNFLYDSSVSPRHPWRIRRYRGYRGRAPVYPYYPSKVNYRKKGEMKILEIPMSGLAFGVPLVGTWIRRLGVGVFRGLFFLKKPEFLSLAMHSWDGIKFEGKSSKNSGEKYLKQLDEMLGFLKKVGYEFKSGEEIYENNKFKKG